MIPVKCDKCKIEMRRQGALVFTPPQLPDLGAVRKIHLCGGCWMVLENWLGLAPDQTDPTVDTSTQGPGAVKGSEE